ncbi:hypothetical protein AK812_SmicGene12701 [Symbiodinium microadriaticum]|uniref:Uncharacterized protein n=1 Tax=Symbiodinium microadriaticum TaxID=2951 RepID=A0A1Q9E9Z0_SYMMI|nr:hypothetical protein AK812_SmicGene12701 [Symbiodinium microadriaticum]
MWLGAPDIDQLQPELSLLAEAATLQEDMDRCLPDAADKPMELPETLQEPTMVTTDAATPKSDATTVRLGDHLHSAERSPPQGRENVEGVLADATAEAKELPGTLKDHEEIKGLCADAPAEPKKLSETLKDPEDIKGFLADATAEPKELSETLKDCDEVGDAVAEPKGLAESMKDPADIKGLWADATAEPDELPETLKEDPAGDRMELPPTHTPEAATVPMDLVTPESEIKACDDTPTPKRAERSRQLHEALNIQMPQSQQAVEPYQAQECQQADKPYLAEEPQQVVEPYLAEECQQADKPYLAEEPQQVVEPYLAEECQQDEPYLAEECQQDEPYQAEECEEDESYQADEPEEDHLHQAEECEEDVPEGQGSRPSSLQEVLRILSTVAVHFATQQD